MARPTAGVGLRLEGMEITARGKEFSTLDHSLLLPLLPLLRGGEEEREAQVSEIPSAFNGPDLTQPTRGPVERVPGISRPTVHILIHLIYGTLKQIASVDRRGDMGPEKRMSQEG